MRRCSARGEKIGGATPDCFAASGRIDRLAHGFASLGFAAALAKLALAAVYRDANRTKEALDLYHQLIAKPTRSVGKVTAQMELAEMYASTQQPAEAKRVYEQMQKENPTSEVAHFATQKPQQLK